MNRQNKRNGMVYGVFPYRTKGMLVAPRGIGELFPSRDKSSRANVLIYMPYHSINTIGKDIYLAYAFADREGFNVGITSNAEAELAEKSDIVLSLFDRSMGKVLHEKLEDYDDGSRLILNNYENRDHFRGSLREIVESIGHKYSQLIA